MEVKDLSWDSTTARSNHKLLPKKRERTDSRKICLWKDHPLTESATKSRMVGFQ